jgi:HTH-type transcriptional regulator/antitoxin HigA
VKTRKRASRTTGDDYLRLIQTFPLRQIRTAAEHAAAIAVLNPLTARATMEPPELSEGEADYLGALAVLIHQYEAPVRGRLAAGITSLDMLKHLMDEAHMSPGELGDVIGSKPAASMILRGQRGISVSQAKTLAKHFNVGIEFFL